MKDKKEAEDPLLPKSSNSLHGSIDDIKNAIKKCRQQHGSRTRNYPILNHQEIKDVQNGSERRLNFNHVLLFLAAYVCVGSLCFFIVRNQIKGNKTNGILDAIYFCVVTMTTVGYGDLVPDSSTSKLLACVLVFAGMALVGFVLSKAADYILEKQEILLVKAMHMRENVGQNVIMKEVEDYKMEYKFITSLTLLVLLVIIGTMFLYKIEGLNLVDSFYCVCATITTLGYGDKSFSTSGGRIFASFWILISTVCLAQAFYNLAELYTERRRRSLTNWVLTRKLTVTDLEAADLDHDKTVSAAEFIVYKLKELGKISEEDVQQVMEGFKALDIDHSGTLTESDLQITRT